MTSPVHMATASFPIHFPDAYCCMRMFLFRPHRKSTSLGSSPQHILHSPNSCIWSVPLSLLHVRLCAERLVIPQPLLYVARPCTPIYRRTNGKYGVLKGLVQKASLNIEASEASSILQGKLRPDILRFEPCIPLFRS